MNKNVLLAMPLGLMVAGCVAVSDFAPVTPDTTCLEDTRPDVACTTANKGKVTLNLQVMQANPPNVCADPGSTIEVKISPKPSAKGTVSVFAKNVTDTWLGGSNSAKADVIHIHVPEWVPAGSYRYGFRTNLGTCVDPRVDVIGNK